MCQTRVSFPCGLLFVMSMEVRVVYLHNMRLIYVHVKQMMYMCNGTVCNSCTKHFT